MPMARLITVRASRLGLPVGHSSCAFSAGASSGSSSASAEASFLLLLRLGQALLGTLERCHSLIHLCVVFAARLLFFFIWSCGEGFVFFGFFLSVLEIVVVFLIELGDVRASFALLLRRSLFFVACLRGLFLCLLRLVVLARFYR